MASTLKDPQLRGLQGALHLAWDTVSSLIMEHEQELLDNMTRFLAGERNEALALGLGPRERVAREIFWRLSEIHSSLESPDLIPHFLEELPDSQLRPDSLTVESYVQYHVEHYLLEVNILTNRVHGFLNWLRRKRQADAGPIAKWKDDFSENLRNIVNLKSRHVHTERYRDDELWRLQSVEYAIAGDRRLGKQLNRHVSVLMRDKARKWAATIRKNNETLRRAVDSMLDDLSASLSRLIERA